MTGHCPYVGTSGTDNSFTLADGVKIFNEELGRLRSLVAIQEAELLHYKMKEKERIRNSVTVDVKEDYSRRQHIAAEIRNVMWLKIKRGMAL